MNKHIWFLVVIAMSLVALIGSAAGCGVVAPTAVAKPTINAFAASPTSINQGERTTLSWNVSGATTVTIEPAIGTVGDSGSLMLSPATNATYTLTATNAAGTDSKSVSVAVTPVVAGKPDLVITDAWLYGPQVNYKVKNIGTAPSNGGETYFYIGTLDPGRQTTIWAKQDRDWLEPLAPGEEITTQFPNFDWSFQFGVIASQDQAYSAQVGYDVKVCVDAEGKTAESNEDNNCLTKIWGWEFTYDFMQNASQATWKSSASPFDLRWPMVTLDDNGAVDLNNFSPFMIICPPQEKDGWIIGKYGELYDVFGDTQMRAFTIPQKAKFTAQVGFAPGQKSSDGIRFTLGYIDDMGSIVWFPKLDVSADGQLHDYVVDLTPLAAYKTMFVIMVEAKGSPDGDCVRVWNPKITQEGSVGGF